MNKTGFIISAAAFAVAASAPSAGAVAQELYGTLKKIKDSGTIVIGHNEDSPPFSYFGEGGKPQGFSIDLCNLIADEVKKRAQDGEARRSVSGGERADAHAPPRQRDH
jgi:ABC-type amino acid transport substrate-binding protein